MRIITCFNQSSSGSFFQFRILAIIVLLLSFQRVFPQCATPGTILDGNSVVLNPDNNGFFSSTGAAWTQTTEEYQLFETPDGLGIGGANQAWTPIIGTEPTGLAVPGDVAAVAGCNNTDITTDSNGGSDYAYYSIIDPDNVADNGDELIAFAIRISDHISGAFSYDFLIDADNNCGSDSNAVCGNPCFEYEVQLKTLNGEVDIIAIDGCVGTSDCDTKNGPSTPNGTDAYICKDCNGIEEALQVCAGSSECGGSNPVFWIFYAKLSDIPSLNSTSTFSIVPATTSSPNAVIYKNTNVSDYGGIGDPNDATACDCQAICLSSSCTDCEKDCALSCAASGGNQISFPVELLSFEGSWGERGIVLDWETGSEENNSHFEIEHSLDGISFSRIGIMQGMGTSPRGQTYQFEDVEAHSVVNYYRLKQVDLNGAFAHSQMIRISRSELTTRMKILENPVQDMLNLRFVHATASNMNIEIHSLAGQSLLSRNISLQQRQSTVALSIDQFSQGIYLLSIRDDRNRLVQVEKFIKK